MTQLTVPGFPKAEQIVALLQRRIRHGDYHGRELPTERELADETGVSRMTARKAIQRLVDLGVLQRQENGRVVTERSVEGGVRLAFLAPSLVSHDVERWRLSVERIAGRNNASVRMILYLHWDDPAILDALDSFSGVFVYPSSEAIPVWIIERMRTAGRSVTIVDRDLSAYGLPSVSLFPPVFIQRLLDRVAALGHRGVDCFNVQATDSVIEQRIEQWNLWRAVHRMPGRILGEPIAGHETPLAGAYRQAGHLLDTNQFTASAILCTTMPAAIGVVRAMQDRGIRVGRDKSVCVVNDEGLGRYLSPSLTSVEMPDPDPYVTVCVERMRQAGEGWLGSLLMQPPEALLFEGESTGPYPAV